MYLETVLPLFPLNLVLMPDMPLPLHIFEERYKKMIRECLDQNREFGIVYISGDEIMQVGCTAKIVKVLKRYEDGEMDIITLGRNRFIIKEVYDGKPYFEAKVLHFDDVPEEESGELLILAREGIESLKELDRIIGIPRDYEDLKDLGAKPVSFLVSGSEGLPLEEKQELLEMTSTRERLKSGVRSLQKVLQATKINKESHEASKGDGSLREILEKYGLD
ncbi:MAG: LON peptidase substrate-binding domain-containing protein [Desulfobacteraceae bacterium]|jgi:Lon protease-like protein